MNKFFSRIKRFFQIPFAEKKLFFEALIFLYAAKIILLIFPFKYCVKLINKKRHYNSNIDFNYLQRIKSAIVRANYFAFWKNVCLVQSVGVRWMLQRRKIESQLSIGVAHDKNKKIIAHAWLKVSHFEMIKKGLDYKELISL